MQGVYERQGHLCVFRLQCPGAAGILQGILCGPCAQEGCAAICPDGVVRCVVPQRLGVRLGRAVKVALDKGFVPLPLELASLGLIRFWSIRNVYLQL